MEEKFLLQANGVTLFCRKMGVGAPVLLIHGACVDSDFFQDTARVLSKSFTVITYDRRGYGRSTTTDDHSIAIQVEDAAAIIHDLNTPCHVIAHSGGTVIAQELAANHPELCKSLLLHEPVDADCSHDDTELQNELSSIRQLIQNRQYGLATIRFAPLFGEADSRARKATDEELKHMDQNCRCFIEYEFIPIFSYSSNASRLLGMPIAVGLGELSQGTHRWDTGNALAHKLNARVVYFPGAHNGPFDLPTEFAWLVRGCLDS